MVLIIKGCGMMIEKNKNQTAVTMSWFSNAYLYAVELLGFVIMAVFCVRDIIFAVQVIRGKKELKSTGKSSPFEKEETL